MAEPAFQQVTPHIYKLDQPFLGGRFKVGVFLVKYEKGWLLVDAGAPGFQDKLTTAVLALTGSDHPHLLVLTHGHLDHVGGVDKLRSLWRPRIAAGRDEIPFLLGSASYRRIPAQSPLYRMAQISGPGLAGANVHFPLDEGQCVGPLEVFHVPGHAPGMIALLHRGDRALLCADTFFHQGGKLSDPPPLFTYSPKLNRASQARLARLDFDHLLPSHGDPILNTGREAARRYVESKTKKKAKAQPA